MGWRMDGVGTGEWGGRRRHGESVWPSVSKTRANNARELRCARVCVVCGPVSGCGWCGTWIMKVCTVN